MLTMDDFNIIENSPGLLHLERCSFLADVETQRHLAMMCIEKAKLCISLGHILVAVNSTKDPTQDYDTPCSVRGRMVLLAPDNSFQISEPERDEISLGKWAANLPDEVIYRRPKSENVNKILTLHASLLQMLYFATTLYATHGSLPNGPFYSPGSQSAYSFAEKARLAAIEITHISQDLQDLNLVRYLPTSGVTPIVLASVVHLRCIKAGNRNIKRTSAKSFSQCMQAMKQLRENYFSADFAFALMIRAARKLEVDSISSTSPRLTETRTAEPCIPEEISLPNGDHGHTNDAMTTDILTHNLAVPASSHETQHSTSMIPGHTTSPHSSDQSFDLSRFTMTYEMSSFYQDQMILEEFNDYGDFRGIFENEGFV